MPSSDPFDARVFIPDGEYLRQNASRQIILVLLLLSYHLWFQMDFACPCNSSRNIFHCYSYMVLPCLIIASIIMWNDMRLGRIFRYFCYHSSATKERCSCKGKFCCEFIIYVLQATVSGFLWCASVLVDGDWYLCCGNSEEVMTLSCMKENKIGPAEKAKKALMKNQSMVMGFICILLTVSCTFIFALPWKRWCTGRNHFRAVFEESILDQTEVILQREMERTAADAVKRSLTNLSTTQTTDNAPEEAEKNKNDDEMLIDKNANWKKVASLVDVLIESIPKKSANNNNNTV